jgi:hypothetical protein
MTATPVKAVTRDPTENNPPSFMNQDVNFVIQTIFQPWGADRKDWNILWRNKQDTL